MMSFVYWKNWTVVKLHNLHKKIVATDDEKLRNHFPLNISDRKLMDRKLMGFAKAHDFHVGRTICTRK
jgi:hypothetical protein